MANLNSLLAKAASDHGERAAVRMDDLVLTYSQLRDAAGRAASLLSSAGVVPGDRVAVMLPNVPAFPIAFYGALGAGATVVPMNPLLKNREVAYYLGDSGAKVLFAWHEAAVEAGKGAAGTGAQVFEVDQPDMGSLLAGRPLAPTAADSGRRRRRGDLVYLRDHWQAQGRRAHAFGPEPQRRADRRHPAER